MENNVGIESFHENRRWRGQYYRDYVDFGQSLWQAESYF